jgi:hypothetical protein
LEFLFFFLDQLWKYDSATKILENKNGDWLHLANTWTLPSEGEEGNIKDVLSAQAKPSLKIRTASAIFWIYLGTFRDFGLKNIFLGIYIFCFSR